MTTTVELDQETAARLDALSSKTGKGKDSLLQMWIENGIEELEEDLMDVARAEEVWERFLQGKEKVYTSEELRASLGLED
jgi:predicted DNA-binding protein